jgi:tetratricopeptide (TPR) repeat protein
MRDLMQKFEQGELSETEEDQVFRLLTQKQEKNKLKALRAEQTSMRVVHRKPMLTMLKAASVLLVVGVGFWFFQNNSTPQYLKLTTDYLAETPAYGSTKLGGTSMTTIEEYEASAKAAYAKGDYEKVVIALSNIISNSEDSKITPEHLYYLSISLMHQKSPDYTKAIQNFQKVQQKSPNFNLYEVNWQLALAYIKTNQFDLARAALQRNEGKFRSADVRRLLDALPRQ